MEKMRDLREKSELSKVFSFAINKRGDGTLMVPIQPAAWLPPAVLSSMCNKENR